MGPRPDRARNADRARRTVFAAACALVVVAGSGPSALRGVAADVGGDHLTTGGVEVGGSLEFYDYGNATPVSAPADTGWTDGTFAATRSDLVPDTLTLDHFGTDLPDTGEPWWDGAWRSRRCFDVDHSGAGASDVTEYQVKVVLDTQSAIAAGEFDADAEDLRAERHDGGGFVDLDLWVDPTTLDGLATEVWVQVDQIPAGASTDFCLYWNNPDPVPVASDEAAVFTSTTLHTLYYTVSDGFGPGADRVDVAPYVDGTQISQDGFPAVSADAGQVTAFTGTGANTFFEATGPVAGVGVDDGQDSLVPVSFAGTEFVVPVARDAQTFSVRSPWATADLEFDDGSTTVTSLSVAPGDGTVTVAADVTASHTAVVRSTNGVPVLLTHRSDVGGDSVVAVPAGTDDLIGLQTQYARLGYGGPGADADVQRSDGTEELVSGDADDTDGFGPSAAGGAGPAVRITDIDTASGAVQQDDGDGGESTMFWPVGELSDRYYVPVDAEHVTVACPESGTEISFGGAPPVACSGNDFGGEFIGRAVDATGWAVTTDALPVVSTGGEPFWLSFDRGSGTGIDDESQVGGLRQGRQVTFPAPQVSARAEEGTYHPAGRWDSAPIDTGADGVYGLLRFAATTPAGTAVRFQLASADTQLASVLAPFVGPDGTASTYFTTSGTPAAYTHDFHRWARVRAYLDTTDPEQTPEVTSLTLDTRLATFGGSIDTPSTVPIASPAGVPTTTWVARVHTGAATFAGSESTIRSAGPPVVPGIDAATVAFGRPDATEVVVAAETVSEPTGPGIAFDASAPHSITLATTVSGPATLDVAWSTLVGGGSPVVEHRFRFELSG